MQTTYLITLIIGFIFGLGVGVPIGIIRIRMYLKKNFPDVDFRHPPQKKREQIPMQNKETENE